jgi:hypothetical protein
MPSIAARAALSIFAVAAIVATMPGLRAARAQDVVQAGGGIVGQAVAVSRGGQRWGVGHYVGSERWDTLLHAAQQAMRECARYDCRVQFQSINPQDRCVTFARGTRSYGIGVGPTPDAARGQALESCAMATTNCHVTDQRCP